MSNTEETTDNNRDIKEGHLSGLDKQLLSIMIVDKTTERNIRWATDHYSEYGKGYQQADPIAIRLITGQNENVIRPRVIKGVQEQKLRSREKAEVFTPSWVCNVQNNLIDRSWFGREDVFNKETSNGWITNKEKVLFEHKSWEEYVLQFRLEIACGEAPYLTSRYDTVTGQYIEVKDRIGLLDRKLRIIRENSETEDDWLRWAKKAVQSVYGYEWQGDSVLLARENILYAVIEAYEDCFLKELSIESKIIFAKVIAWNIWQMDGIKMVIPNSCHENTIHNIMGDPVFTECLGCQKSDIFEHNGIYSRVMDWDIHKTLRFVDLLKAGRKNGRV